ncbi:ATP-binding protein [Nocardioides speluncae]|uniref:ATP-binding protein n=1 Tax=Nocardioides speluncae TaxID=2670337 RepID=UPI00137A45D2|nr:AAA family ATPase [Nocardioides speluncae]
MAITHPPRAELVGRDPELAALALAVDDAGMGRGRVVLLTGEAGIGKTCLAEAADALARAGGFDVVWGRCSADDAPAYWLWSQVLAAIGRSDLIEPGRFPSRAEMFAAVAEAVLARSRGRPLLVVAEDLHWADSGSLRLAEFLAAVVAGERLLLLATSREGFADRLPNAGVRRIALAGLDLEQTGELVRRYVEAEPAEEYLAEVFRRTGGNPFFVSEVAHLQASRRCPAGAVPAGVRQVLEHRLARLPQGSVELLQMASVLGAPRRDALAAMAGLPVAEVDELLAGPVAAGLVAAEGFAHELVREALYDGIAPGVRAELHRRVAETLQAAGPAELARHWSLAAGRDALRHTAELAVVAGDLAVAGQAHEQAAGHYRLALESGDRSLAVRRRLGEALVQAGQIEDGRRALHEVAVEARAGEDADTLARAVLAFGGGVGGFEVDTFDAEQRTFLQEALRLLPEADSDLRAAVLARLSIASAATLPAEERADLARQAASMAAAVADPGAEVAALAALCDARSGPDHVDERIAAASRMIQLAAGNAVLELLGRRLRLRARLERGDFAGVEADLAGYARVAERLRSPTYTWLVPMWRGMLALRAGDFALASSLADELDSLAVQAQSANAEMMGWGLRFHIARARRDIAAIREMTGLIIDGLEDYPAWRCMLALVYAELGEAERGRQLVRRILASGLDAVPKDSEWVELIWVLGEAALLLDEGDAVHAVHTAMEPYADLWAVDGFGNACFGQVRELLDRLAAYDGGPAAPDPARAAFVRSGAVWSLAFRGRTASVVDSKGMHDLATLLARPGVEVHALDLVEAAGGPARDEAGADTGPQLDAAARAAYQRRLRELEDEIEEAARDHDRGRLERLDDEKSFLVAELSAALGLGGRVRVTGDRAERARKAVTMRIATASRAIGRVHPELARHLAVSVTTGRYCCYRPDQDVDWQLS